MTAAETGMRHRVVAREGVAAQDAETAMLMHDIRSALNGVVGGIALVDASMLTAEASAQFERISAASRVLLSLVEKVIGHDDVSEDANTLNTFVDLHEYQSFVVSRWRGEAESKGLGFEVKFGPNIPQGLDCAAIDLSRMIGNLTSNAIRYTRSGRIVISFTRAVLGGLEIEVRDTGPGVSESILRFVSFPHVSGSDAADGRHGWGLQIVKSLVADVGGRFSLRNDAEGGLIASIWLPERLCVYSDQPSRLGAVGRNEVSFPKLVGARVLLAEDNPTNQMVARQMLDALKAEVFVCFDGVEALEAYDAHEFDLVLVDIEMPRLSGLDVIRTIRQMPGERSRVPIVALTAYAMREHRKQIADSGANGLISKPITGIEELGRSLSSFLVQSPAPGLTSSGSSCPPEDDVQTIDRDVYDPLVAAIGPEHWEELLEKVLTDLVGAERDLERARIPHDLEVVQGASHILISVGGAIGATRLLACARAVNVSVHKRDFARLPGQVRECIQEAGRAISFVSGERQVVRN
jgi:two-component system, OmpR family, aerobic respiration control sensor histidine kinase ArcB